MSKRTRDCVRPYRDNAFTSTFNSPHFMIILLRFCGEVKNLNNTCRCIRSILSQAAFTISSDITFGVESNPIPYYGNVDSIEGLISYYYSIELYNSEGHCDSDFISGCNCEINGIACGSSKCLCKQLNVFAGDPLDQTFACHSCCKCSDTCKLRTTFEKCQHHLYVKQIGMKGLGVCAQKVIPKNSFVSLYSGEVLNSDELAKRRPQYDDKEINYVLTAAEHFRTSEKSRSIHIDATRQGNISRFFNHSCAPSLEVKFVHRGSMNPTLAFFSSKDIFPGDELTFSYGNATPPISSSKQCLCGEQICSGFLPNN